MYLCVFRRDATSINNFVRFLEHFFRERGGNTNIYMSYNHFFVYIINGSGVEEYISPYRTNFSAEV